MKEFKVVGMPYAWDENARIVFFSEQRMPERIKVVSQFGWQDGCRHRNSRFLKNAKVVRYVPGDAYSLGVCVLLAEEMNEEEVAKFVEEQAKARA